MTAPAGSGYELFGQRQFRNLWSANLLFNLCLVMLTLGVSWTMTSLTADPLPISLVQTAMSLPFLIFGIPSGIATDTLGPRTVLVVSQVWMLAVTGLMGVIALYGGWRFTPALLLSMTFLVGVGVVAQQAAWKPFLQDQVGGDGLIAAISFNSLSSDAGRAIGPVAGGYLMGFFGPAVVLFTSAVSQLVMILTVNAGRPIAKPSAAAAGKLPLGDGLRFLRRSKELSGPMIRTALLMIPCGAVLGLLPLEAKENIQTGPIGYGGLLAALGIGTAAGGALMPIMQRHIRSAPLSAVAVIVFSLTVVGVSRWDSMLLDAAFLLVLGVAWSILSIDTQFAVQIASPERMRGLMTSFYALAVQGSIALGSLAFGLLAQRVGVSSSILAAGVAALSPLLFIARRPPRSVG